MTIKTDLLKFFKTQADLAFVISGGSVNNASRIKAHRIFQGKGKPTQEEIVLIYKATKGKIDANYFSGLPIKKLKKPQSN